MDGLYTKSIDLAVADIPGTLIKLTGFPGFRDQYVDLGDINGDEIGDLIIGEPAFGIEGNEEEHTAEGRSDLVWGPMEPQDMDVAQLFEDGLGSRVTGSQLGQVVGRSVGSAGDANGDGLADAVTTVDSGRTAVIFGDATAMDLTTADVEAGLGGYIIDAPDSNLLLPLGDVNGDGLADHAQIGSGKTGGTVSVIYGKQDFEPVTLAELKVGVGGFIIDVLDLYASDDYFGSSGTSLGDFDGDGWNDLVIAAAMAPASRKIFMIRGAETWGQPSFATLQAENRVRLFEGTVGAVTALSFVGDLTGDGRAELLAGNDFTDTVHLVFGQEGTDTISLKSLVEDKAGVQFDTLGHTGLGSGVIGTNDLTGDGIVDFVRALHGHRPRAARMPAEYTLSTAPRSWPRFSQVNGPIVANEWHEHRAANVAGTRASPRRTSGG